MRLKGDNVKFYFNGKDLTLQQNDLQIREEITTIDITSLADNAERFGIGGIVSTLSHSGFLVEDDVVSDFGVDLTEDSDSFLMTIAREKVAPIGSFCVFGNVGLRTDYSVPIERNTYLGVSGEYTGSLLFPNGQLIMRYTNTQATTYATSLAAIVRHETKFNWGAVVQRNNGTGTDSGVRFRVFYETSSGRHYLVNRELDFGTTGTNREGYVFAGTETFPSGTDSLGEIQAEIIRTSDLNSAGTEILAAVALTENVRPFDDIPRGRNMDLEPSANFPIHFASYELPDPIEEADLNGLGFFITAMRYDYADVEVENPRTARILIAWQDRDFSPAKVVFDGVDQTSAVRFGAVSGTAWRYIVTNNNLNAGVYQFRLSR